MRQACLLALAALVLAAPARGADHRIVRDRIVWSDGSRPLRLPDYATAALRSPDRRLIAVGDSGLGRLRFVDLVRRRVVFAAKADLSPLGFATVTPLLWRRPDRVVAGSWTGDAHRTAAEGLVVVNPLRRRVVRRLRIGEAVAAPRAAGGGAVALLAAPRERVGWARLVLARPDGAVRQVPLRRIRAGGGRARTRNRYPGLAVDARGRRAYVVAEGDGVAEIDLRSLHVTYHGLRGAFRGRPQGIASAPASTGTANPSRTLGREARWLGNGLVAVTGWDSWPAAGGRERHVAAGLTLLDTRSWRTRVVDRRVSRVVYEHGLLLAERTRWSSRYRTRIGAGIAVFDREGKLLVRRFTRNSAVVLGLRGRRLRVGFFGRRRRPLVRVVRLPAARG